MEREQLFKIGLRIGDGCIDYPFENDFETAVFRRKDNRKWFGIYLGVPKKYFGEREGSEFCLNLKCPPELSIFLRESRTGIYPAWHMNKRNWITVRLHAVDEEELEKLFMLSYDLCNDKKRTREKRKQNL